MCSLKEQEVRDLKSDPIKLVICILGEEIPLFLKQRLGICLDDLSITLGHRLYPSQREPYQLPINMECDFHADTSQCHVLLP